MKRLRHYNLTQQSRQSIFSLLWMGIKLLQIARPDLKNSTWTNPKKKFRINLARRAETRCLRTITLLPGAWGRVKITIAFPNLRIIRTSQFHQAHKKKLKIKDVWATSKDWIEQSMSTKVGVPSLRLALKMVSWALLGSGNRPRGRESGERKEESLKRKWVGILDGLFQPSELCWVSNQS